MRQFQTVLFIFISCVSISGTQSVFAEDPEKPQSHRQRKIQQAIDSFSQDSNEAITRGLQAVVGVIKKDVRRIAGKDGQPEEVAVAPVEGDAGPREQAMRITGKGTIEAMLGNLDKAVGYYRQAIATDPTFPTAYYNLGAAFARQGKESHALNALNKALTLDPVYRKMAQRDKDYRSLHDHKEFVALTSAGARPDQTSAAPEAVTTGDASSN